MDGDGGEELCSKTIRGNACGKDDFASDVGGEVSGNFCASCIKGVWHVEGEVGRFSCKGLEENWELEFPDVLRRVDMRVFRKFSAMV